MIEHFDMKRVSLGGPIFDIDKLNWLNGLWIRENLTDEELMARFFDWKFNPEFWQRCYRRLKRALIRSQT